MVSIRKKQSKILLTSNQKMYKLVVNTLVLFYSCIFLNKLCLSGNALFLHYKVRKKKRFPYISVLICNLYGPLGLHG